LNAVDYLLKPISFDRFLRAVNKIFQQRTASSDAVSNVEAPSATEGSSYIHLKSNKKMVKIPIDDILYIESMKDYVLVHTIKRDVISYQKISFLEEKLPTDRFLRIHRSFIVAKDKVEAFCATHVEVKEKELPIGRNYKNQVLKSLSQDNILS